eukprot:2503539-Rhodomonas_salina.4
MLPSTRLKYPQAWRSPRALPSRTRSSAAGCSSSVPARLGRNCQCISSTSISPLSKGVNRMRTGTTSASSSRLNAAPAGRGPLACAGGLECYDPRSPSGIRTHHGHQHRGGSDSDRSCGSRSAPGATSHQPWPSRGRAEGGVLLA